MENLEIGFASPSSYIPSKFECVQWDDLEMDDIAGDAAAATEVDNLAHTVTEAYPTVGLDNSFQVASVVLPPRRSRPLPTTEWRRHRDEIIRLYIHEEHELEEVVKLMRERRGFVAAYVTPLLMHLC
jgi:hypothetical protein